ncbi:MAG TPA: long-chain fatty acid--CoA ligase [Steroidobacteraceae bacterium]|nr:long-chain fatty acid--CoA ligase [Steroidobacteraceae bacterium]
MHGLMQDHELLISSLIRHAATHHPRREVVSREATGTLHRTSYLEVEQRARRLAAALAALGVRAGERVATLGSSTHRHLECFYGISGMGAVLHTVNPRLFRDQLCYIMNHAEDRVLLFDSDLLPLVESLAPQLESVRAYVVLDGRAAMPLRSPLAPLCYEELIADAPDDYAWPTFDERSASSLCYTSGTTGNPKGVLYSHRSTVIHALAAIQGDVFALRAVDVALPIAPMFHANGWSLPYSCAMTGAKLVLPGRMLDARSLHELIQGERVTFAGAVPSIWTMLLAYLSETGQTMPTLERVLIGGAAMPAAVCAGLAEHGVRALHAWGMTETSPLGTVATPTADVEALPLEERAAQLGKQGRALWGVEVKITDAEGHLVPRDGAAFGALWVRGPWVASGYFKGEGGEVLDGEGWFPTGDVATWDRFGFLKITDRTKDVIKSGGEWISSIEIENLAMSHPKVRLAAAVAAHHPKWGERPVLIVVAHAGERPTRAELLEFLTPRMAKWWLPDDVVFVQEIPLTATGKMLKSRLREQYWNHLVAGNVVG